MNNQLINNTALRPMIMMIIKKEVIHAMKRFFSSIFLFFCVLFLVYRFRFVTLFITLYALVFLFTIWIFVTAIVFSSFVLFLWNFYIYYICVVVILSFVCIFNCSLCSHKYFKYSLTPDEMKSNTILGIMCYSNRI